MKFAISMKVLMYCAVAGSLIFIGGIVLGFKIFPSIVMKKVWENTILYENTTQWKNFLKTPFPFTFKVYIFNIENPEEVLSGTAKPSVKEIGPYVYKINRWKTDIEWNSDDISYYEYSLYRFDKYASGKLSENDEITTLNTPYYSLLLTVENLSPDALETVNDALPGIFQENNSPFIKTRVKDYLFEGIKLCKNYDKNDFGINAICNQIKAKIKTTKTMRLINDTVLFANLHYKNNTHLGRFTINSGQKNYDDLYKLKEYDGKKLTSIWNGENNSKCESIRGITNFQPHIDRNMSFEIYSEDICRHMEMRFDSETEYQGMNGYKFRIRNDTFKQPTVNSDDYCYCINRTELLVNDDGCLKDGLLDLYNCLEIFVKMPRSTVDTSVTLKMSHFNQAKQLASYSGRKLIKCLSNPQKWGRV